MKDKVVILRTHKGDIYLREQGDAANQKRLDAYKAELPAFAYWLQKEFCVPKELPVGCSPARSGALIYRDQEAIKILHDESPAGQLEDLLREFIEYIYSTKQYDDSIMMYTSRTIGESEFNKPVKTAKIRNYIKSYDRYRHDTRLPSTTQMMGIYMKQIADREGSCVDVAGKDRNGVALWQLLPPECRNDEDAAA